MTRFVLVFRQNFSQQKSYARQKIFLQLLYPFPFKNCKKSSCIFLIFSFPICCKSITASFDALKMMADAGYPITADIDVVLDEKLPYMGYTTEQHGKPVIVVSGGALDSGAAINLLIHELSHVYRSLTHHPSHDYNLLTSITAWVMHGKAVEEYQEKILHAILNHVQDLYADDITFKIYKEYSADLNLNEFFKSWIRKPHKNPKTPEQRWENADVLLSAAFAQANLERHNIEDREGSIAKAIKTLLSQMNTPMTEQYDFFKRFMLLMPEEVSQKQFESMLITYLNEFLKLTKQK